MPHDRNGWMHDRQRMFKGGVMTVGVSELKVAPAGGGATITFVQTFASGNYRDVGKKLLVLRPEGGALKIAREEMLSSQLRSRAAAAAALAEFAFVVDGRVVLAPDAREEWTRGPVL